MITARADYTATLLLDGTVLVAGGSDSRTAPAFAELYDPRSGSWTVARNLVTPRWLHTGTLLPNGKVLVAGGISNGDYLASAELYDPASGT